MNRTASSAESPTPLDDPSDITTEPDAISILVIDGQLMVAQALSALLGAEDGLIVVGTASTRDEALALVEQTRPAIVLMDFYLSESAALLTTAIVGSTFTTQVIALAPTADAVSLRRAIEAGAVGAVGKDQDVSELLAAILATHRGEAVMSASTLLGLLRSAPWQRRSEPQQPHPEYLTPREVEILGLLIDGASTDRICRELLLSKNTVRNHVWNILVKLGAHSRIEAVAIALRQGIVTAAVAS